MITRDDCVNGQIIGGSDYRLLKLVSPTGRVQRREYVDDSVPALDWAKRTLEGMRAEMSAAPGLFEEVYGAGDWTVREHN